jgi:hypothetical protein
MSRPLQVRSTARSQIICGGGHLFRLRGDEVIFEEGDWMGRSLKGRWPRERIVKISALADVDPPGSFRPRCRLVMELRDEPVAIELVSRGKAEKMQNLARDVNRALGLIPAEEIRAPAARATEDEYWISKGTLRRQAAERWLAGAPTDLPGGTIESPEPSPDGGPPVLSYQPDPKDMVLEERWPGRLRLYVPAASGSAVLRDPMTIGLGFFLTLLFLKLIVSPAIRAAYFPVPLPPTAFLLIVTAVLTANTARKFGRSIIEVDVNELTLTYRWLLGIGWTKRWLPTASRT